MFPNRVDMGSGDVTPQGDVSARVLTGGNA